MTPNVEQKLAIYGIDAGLAVNMGGHPQPALRVVIAGPGSGKTFTLTECVKHHAATDVIAVMTFTNAAAYEMRKRLSGDWASWDAAIAERLAFIGTTHSYCFKLIQKYGQMIGYRSGQVAILPEAERIPRLLAVRDKLGIKISQEKLLDVTGQFVFSEVGRERVLILNEYEFTLKQNNLVDFDSMLREGAALLQLDQVRAKAKLDWLFVDERQDSSPEDQAIYDLIPATHKFYVGDPDQSIYQFRGADPEGLVRLVEVPGAEVIKLECNYRSDISICDAANKLIAHNKLRVDKKIVPVSESTGTIAVVHHEDTWQEQEWLAICIRKVPADLSIAVLCRTNYEVNRCHNYLAAQHIQVRRQYQVQRPPDWQRALLLLSLAASPDNEILAERYLKLDNPSAIVDQWLLESKAGGSEFASRVQHILTSTLHKAPRFLAENGVGPVTIDVIKQRSDLLPPESTLIDLLQDLYAHEDEQREEPGEGIHAGTIHSAKGREWDVVFLPAFEETVIPSLREEGGGRIEEERRLAFVAVTRAKYELYISWSEKRQFQWGGVQDMKPSRFISEMGL